MLNAEMECLWIMSVAFLLSLRYSRGTDEYCQWEAFNVSCQADEFIKMTSALYGRMNVGRCVPVDYFTRCSLDVLPQMEARCSGRRSCTVNISDRELFRMQPCRKDLVAYLEASYQCIRVSGMKSRTDLDQGCLGPNRIDETSGYLASLVTLQTGVGSRNCPWVLEAQPGQSFQFTLVDFAQRTEDTPQPEDIRPIGGSNSNRKRTDCAIAAVISESPTEVDPDEDDGEFSDWISHDDTGFHHLQLCSESDRRFSTYKSVSNRVTVHWTINDTAFHHAASDVIGATGTGPTGSQLFIKFEVLGCPDLAAPQHAWLTRNGDHLIVNCNYTAERWHIVCNGHSWVSQISNCSSPTVDGSIVQSENEIKQPKGFPFGLLVAVAVGVIIGIAIGFLFLLLVCICRRRIGRQRKFRDAENRDRENIYKLIELRSQPTEMDGEYGLSTQPCTCFFPDVQMTSSGCSSCPQDLEAVYGVPGNRTGTFKSKKTLSGGGGVGGEGNNRALNKFDSLNQRRSIGGGTTALWPKDKSRNGNNNHRQPEVCYTTEERLHRCTCSSGNCIHPHEAPPSLANTIGNGLTSVNPDSCAILGNEEMLPS